MNVILVSGDFPPIISGVGDYTFHVAKSMASLPVNVEVITSDLGTDNVFDLSDDIQCHRCMKFWGGREAKKIIERIPADRKDCVINIQYNSPMFYKRNLMINFLPLFLRFFRPSARVIVTMHGFWEQSWLYRLRTIPMLRLSHGVIYVDKKNRFQLERLSGKSGKQLKFIPIASNIVPIKSTPEKRQQWRREINLSDSDMVISFFGGIGQNKGTMSLLKAIKLIRDDNAFSVVLIFIGGFNSDGINLEYQDYIQAKIDEFGLRENVRIIHTPSAEKVSSLLYASDIAAYPFTNGVGENSGSMLAALAHGLPTVVTSGGTEDDNKFSHEFGVYMVEPDNERQLADAFINIYSSDEIQLSMNKDNLAINKKNNWNSIATQTMGFFEHIITNDESS